MNLKAGEFTLNDKSKRRRWVDPAFAGSLLDQVFQRLVRYRAGDGYVLPMRDVGQREQRRSIGAARRRSAGRDRVIGGA